MLQPKVVRVVPNPYAALDHLGRPSGVVLLDPVDHVPYQDNEGHKNPSLRWQARRFVGATRHSKVLIPADKRKGTEAVHDHHWHHQAEPVNVPFSLYYREHVMTGDLFAADVESWVTFGGQAKTFRDPKDLLADAKEGIIDQHIAMHGELRRVDEKGKALESIADAVDRHVKAGKLPKSTVDHVLGGTCPHCPQAAAPATPAAAPSPAPPTAPASPQALSKTTTKSEGT